MADVEIETGPSSFGAFEVESDAYTQPYTTGSVSMGGLSIDGSIFVLGKKIILTTLAVSSASVDVTHSTTGEASVIGVQSVAVDSRV